MVLLNIVVPLNRNIIHDRYTPNSARRPVKGSLVVLIYTTKQKKPCTGAEDKHVKGLLSSHNILIDFSLTVKAATLIFISGRGSAISSAKEGKSGFIYTLAKS